MSQPVLSALDCRRLLLSAQGLFDDPARPPGIEALYQLIVRLGFVQVDSINVVARAHHLILFNRLDGYQPTHLTHLLETDRRLFEHWTHDASVIPTQWFRYWRHRFARHEGRIRRNAWWQERLGEEPERVLAEVLQRVVRDGPLRSSELETPPGTKQDAWWSWKPQKAALEHLWLCGKVAVHSRHNFQKVYDLTERVLPHGVQQPPVTPKAYVAWACENALERLLVATPTELAKFWRSVTPADARTWCTAAVKRGQAVAVLADGREAVAVVDWRQRLSGSAPRRIRLLCPFDPILRDRDRLERLFGFSYRFEAFVPAPKRQHGYYVLPILDGQDLVGRLDAKVHRAVRTLEVNGLWWEPGVKVTARRQKALTAALERLAGFVGAVTIKTSGR